jgi:hypothetical protein
MAQVEGDTNSDPLATLELTPVGASVMEADDGRGRRWHPAERRCRWWSRKWHPPPSRRLPPETAPPQLALDVA